MSTRSARTGSRRGVAPRHAPADSGLRLLMATPGSGALRWAPDPDAPAMRALADGELRLAIRCFQLGRAELTPARRQPAPAWPRQVDEWQSVPAMGTAVVIESRVVGAAVGLALRGPVHVGTHRVLTGDALAREGFVPLGDRAGAGTRCHGERCGWRVDGCAGGIIAVERAIDLLRDGSHAEGASGLLSLSLRPSTEAVQAPITAASCCLQLQRRAHSSIGRRAT